MSKSIRWVSGPTSIDLLERARRLAVRSLRRLAFTLVSLSRVLRRPPTVAAPDSLSFEFHADAGAPEGALYVNGVRVGSIEGVRRL
jgi:hypothetical protein